MKEDDFKIDVGGNIKGLDGLLGELGNIGKLIESASKLAENTGNLTDEQQERLAEAKEMLGEQGMTTSGNDKFQIAHGFNISSMGGRSATDKPHREKSSGSAFTGGGKKRPKTSPKPPEVERHEPIVDLFEEDDGIHIVVEMPGIEEKEISLGINEKALSLVVNGKRKYQKEIDLPQPARSEDMAWTYRNGILDIKIKNQRTNK